MEIETQARLFRILGGAIGTTLAYMTFPAAYAPNWAVASFVAYSVGVLFTSRLTP